MSRRLTTEEFIAKAQKVHGDKYGYDKTKYITSTDKVEIYCKVHKKYFWQIAMSHSIGQGCQTCGIEETNRKNTDTTASFIAKASKLHNNKYSYENTIYTKIINQVNITCPHHGPFLQRPVDHLEGSGCHVCANNRTRAKYIKEPTILYQVYFPDSGLYKIGITLVRIGTKQRFYGETGVVILNEKYFLSGKDAYQEEQLLLQEHKDKLYAGEHVLAKGGNSELLTSQIQIIG